MCWEEVWGLRVLFRKGRTGQSSCSLWTKERVAGFLSGGGVFITPFHEPVVPSGLVPISEVPMSFKIFFAVCSVTHLGLTLCNPMAYSIPGLPVPHHLSKFVQVQVHCIGDAIQPSHPLKPSSPSAFNLSQHQGLFQSVRCLHLMTKLLELHHQSFQWVFRVDFPYYWLVWSPCCPRDFLESSLAPQFEGITYLAFYFFMVQLSQLFMTAGMSIALTTWTLLAEQCLYFSAHHLGLS